MLNFMDFRMDEDSDEPRASDPSTATSSNLNGVQPNCLAQTTISVQHSLPSFFSRNNRAVIDQPRTIPPTPPPNSKEGIGCPLAGAIIPQQDETGNSPLTNRTQLLNVSQMVRQQSDTTNNRRLIRSAAICDDRPATSNATAQVSGGFY
jgi:hypothetical protein